MCIRDRMDGGVDTLTTRIAFVRTWATLAHRRDWFDDPEAWRERARDIEERLSDALHEELTRRFVDRRIRRGWTPALDNGTVMAEGRQVGHVRGLRVVTPGLSGHQAQQVRAAASPALRARAEAICASEDARFSMGCDGVLCHDDEAIGGLVRGPHPLAPEVMVDSHALPSELVQRVRERLTWWVRKELDGLLAPLRGPELVSLAGGPRAVLARAIDHLGLLQRWGHAEVTRPLDDSDWRVLDHAGLVRHGDLLVFMPMFRGDWHRWRPALARAHWGQLPELPGPVAPRRVRVGPGGDDRQWERLGYVLRGADAIRLDQVTRKRGPSGRGRKRR